MANFITVARASDFAAGAGKVVEAGGRPIALFNVGGSFYAIDNACLHRGGPLGEGELDGDLVTCPWHGWQWNVRTGANAMNPQFCVKAYPVAVEGDEVKIAVEG